MIFLLDNYDSFTYNLVHYVEELGQKVKVERNDKISIEQVLKLNPEKIIISPGPCNPDKAGISLELVKLAAENKIPLLGVCLGHQAIAQAFGGKVIRDKIPNHGKIFSVKHTTENIYNNIKNPFNATRYHSLIVEKKSLPPVFNITAETEDGTIMGIEHKELPIFGMQYHPESIATEHGHDLIRNFLELK